MNPNVIFKTNNAHRVNWRLLADGTAERSASSGGHHFVERFSDEQPPKSLLDAAAAAGVPLRAGRAYRFQGSPTFRELRERRNA